MADTPRGRVEDIRAFLRLSETLGTAGLPTPEQVPAIRDAGYEVVINLLPDAYDGVPEERARVEELGMEYVQIPVLWMAPQPQDLTRFFAAMEANADRRVFVHCAANMRVSAFVYLYRVLRQGMPPDEAARDLRRIWNPDENAAWKPFLDAALRRGEGGA